MAELKPIERCPFCGGFGNLCQAENKVYEDVPKYLWFVKCDNKLCAIKPITPLYATEQQAIDAWNKRSWYEIEASKKDLQQPHKR